MRRRLLGILPLMLALSLTLGVVQVGATEVDEPTQEEESSDSEIVIGEDGLPYKDNVLYLPDTDDLSDVEGDLDHIYDGDKDPSDEIESRGEFKFDYKKLDTLKDDETDNKIIGADYQLIVTLPEYKINGEWIKDKVVCIEQATGDGLINGMDICSNKLNLDKVNIEILTDNLKELPLVIYTDFGTYDVVIKNLDYVKLEETEKYVKPDTTQIKLTISDIPKKNSITEPFEITITSNIKASVSINGSEIGSNKKKFKYLVTDNGTFVCKGVGFNSTEYITDFDVNSFKDVKADSGDTLVSNYTDNNDDKTLVQTDIKTNLVFYISIFVILSVVMFFILRRVKYHAYKKK